MTDFDIVDGKLMRLPDQPDDSLWTVEPVPWLSDLLGGQYVAVRHTDGSFFVCNPAIYADLVAEPEGEQ